MAAESESILLHRFCARGDAEAFSEIVQRHAGMVYGVCIRLLKDSSDAADVTQQTFFLLLRQARDISGSLAGWLHTVATRKSIDLVRRTHARRNAEQNYAAARPQKAETWQQISPCVDEALEELDTNLRQMLIEHFFEGSTTTSIAARHNISQPTVSRRINQALALLRTALSRRGLIASAAALAALLPQATAKAVPTLVARELSKMALMSSAAAVGAGAGAGAKVAGGGILAALNAKVVATAAVVAIAAGSVATYHHISKTPENSGVTTPEYVTGRTPQRDASPRRSQSRRPTITYVARSNVAPASQPDAAADTDWKEFDRWFENLLAEEPDRAPGTATTKGRPMGGYPDVPVSGMAMGAIAPVDANSFEQQQPAGMLVGTYAPEYQPETGLPAIDPNEFQDGSSYDDE